MQLFSVLNTPNINIENKGGWVWQDSSAMIYNNWRGNEPNQGPNGGGCARKTPNSNGAWADIGCTDSQLLKKYSCNMDAVQSCDSSQALEYMLRRRSCIKHAAKKFKPKFGFKIS